MASSVLALLKKQKSQQAQLLAGSGWDNRWGLVFTNELGGHLAHFTVYKHFKEAVRAIGLDEERFHDLRHTRAIHLYRGGMPLSILSEFLGHVSEETTRVYAYADTEMKRKAIENATPKTIPGNEAPIWDTSDDEVPRRLAGLC